MRSFRSSLLIPAAALLGAGVLACSGGNTPVAPSSNSNSSSSSGSSHNSTGTVSIKLTDSPFSDAKALLVTFSEVSIHSADTGEWQTLPFAAGSSRTCDLKKLQGPTDILGVGSLTAGKYTQIRLNVTSAAIYFENASQGEACAAQIAAPAGSSASVDVPSGEVKLNNEFTVASGGGKTILLDFDGDKSIHQAGSGNGKGNASVKYMMVPVIRVVSVQ
ncbi:MAG: DUF4382 domain-containing protein [Betaproteobacteria bacterium]